MSELKLCPFCGSAAKELAEGYVSCFNPTCPMSSMSMTVEAWNRRAKDAESVSKLVRHDPVNESCSSCKHGPTDGNSPSCDGCYDSGNMRYFNFEAKEAKHTADGKGAEVVTCASCQYLDGKSLINWNNCRAREMIVRDTDTACPQYNTKLATVKTAEPISIGKGTKMCNECRRIEAVCICEKPARVKEIEPLDLLAAFRSESVSGAIADKLNEIIDAINEMRKR